MTNWNIKFKKMDIFETNERENGYFIVLSIQFDTDTPAFTVHSS